MAATTTGIAVAGSGNIVVDGSDAECLRPGMAIRVAGKRHKVEEVTRLTGPEYRLHLNPALRIDVPDNAPIYMA